MARIFDYRQTGSDEEAVTLDAYGNETGDIIINMDDETNNDENKTPKLFLSMNIKEAKKLKKELDNAIQESLQELTAE